jgi:hypothetical protein
VASSSNSPTQIKRKKEKKRQQSQINPNCPQFNQSNQPKKKSSFLVKLAGVHWLSHFPSNFAVAINGHQHQLRRLLLVEVDGLTHRPLRLKGMEVIATWGLLWVHDSLDWFKGESLPETMVFAIKYRVS